MDNVNEQRRTSINRNSQEDEKKGKPETQKSAATS